MKSGTRTRNLEGAGSLERDKPTSLFFEILGHREQYP
jgi:hypothetical protein